MIFFLFHLPPPSCFASSFLILLGCNNNHRHNQAGKKQGKQQTLEVEMSFHFIFVSCARSSSSAMPAFCFCSAFRGELVSFGFVSWCGASFHFDVVLCSLIEDTNGDVQGWVLLYAVQCCCIV